MLFGYMQLYYSSYCTNVSHSVSNISLFDLKEICLVLVYLLVKLAPTVPLLAKAVGVCTPPVNPCLLELKGT